MQANLPKNLKGIGLVIIGRNEGERFVACLASLPDDLPAIYVDSGSTDNSVANAMAANVHVAKLSSNSEFTAARARNLGWRTLIKKFPNLKFIQFIDGDCSLDAGWIGEAMVAINQSSQLAIVFGRRRERFPEMSFYNAQCDREWDVPVGEVFSCGGDAFMRVAALDEVGGYNDELIAGEEPDLCLRMRSLGWRIRRIEPEMTMHDAAIYSSRGWWRRAKRAGHGYTEHVFIHGRSAIPDWSRSVASMLAWAIFLPFLMILGVILGLVSSPMWFFLSMASGFTYIFQFVRLAKYAMNSGLSKQSSYAEAFYLLLAKFAHCAGAGTYLFNLIRGKRPVLLEYK